MGEDTVNAAEEEEQGDVLARYKAWLSLGHEQTHYGILGMVAEASNPGSTLEQFVEGLRTGTFDKDDLRKALDNLTLNKQKNEAYKYGVKYLKELLQSGVDAAKTHLIALYDAWTELQDEYFKLVDSYNSGNGDVMWLEMRHNLIPRFNVSRDDWIMFVGLEKEKESAAKEKSEANKRAKALTDWQKNGVEKTLYDTLKKIFTNGKDTVDQQLHTEMENMRNLVDGWETRLLDRVSTYTTTNKTRQSKVEKEQGIIQLLESWVILGASLELRDFVQGVYAFGQQLLEKESRLRSGDAQWNDVVDMMNKARVDLQNKIENWKQDAREQVVVNNARIDALAQEERQREEKAEEMRLMFQIWLGDGWEEQLYNMLNTIFTDGDSGNADGALKNFVNTLRHASYETKSVSDTDLPEATVLGLLSDYEEQLLDKIRLYVNSRKPSQDLKDIGAIDMLKELVADETKTEEAKTEEAKQFVIATYDDWMSLMSAMNVVMERGDTAWDEFDSGVTKAYMEEKRRLWKEKKQAKQAEKEKKQAEKAEKAEKQAKQAEKEKERQEERERKQTVKEKAETEAAQTQRSSALKTFNDSFANATEDMFIGYYDSVKRHAQEKSDFSSSNKEEAVNFLKKIPGYMTYETQDGTMRTLNEEQQEDAFSRFRVAIVVNAMWRVEDGGDAQRQAETEVRAALHNALNSEQKRPSRNSLTNGSVAQARAVGGVFPEDTWNALKDVSGDIHSVIMYKKMQIIQNYVEGVEKEKKTKSQEIGKQINATDDEARKETYRWDQQYYILIKDATISNFYDPIVKDLIAETEEVAKTLKVEREAREAEEKKAREIQREKDEQTALAEKEAKRKERAKNSKERQQNMAAKKKDAAKRAAAARKIKNQEMHQKAKDSLSDTLKTKLEENSLLAIALAWHEDERVRKQEELDSIQGAARASDVYDFPWLEGDDLPEQPVEKRSRAWKNEGVEWPVAQVPLTEEQHALLFITDGQFQLLVPGTDGVSDGASDTATEPPQSPAAAPMAEEEDQTTPMDVAPSSGTGEYYATKSSALLSGTDENGSTSGNKPPLNGYSPYTMPDAAGVMNLSVLLFNKPYARFVLAAHLRSIKFAHLDAMVTNHKAEYVDVAGALGPLQDESSSDNKKLVTELARLKKLKTGEAEEAEKRQKLQQTVSEARIDQSVEMLLPTFEALLRYRNTILKVKEIDLHQQIQIVSEGSTLSLRNSLKEIASLNVKEEWQVPAMLMLQGDRGLLPGQLHIPQPSQLPLRISAPPRVGKSATALLVASIAKRVGMCCMYSVSPDKKTPIDEMKTKLTRIGWRSEGQMPALKPTANDTTKECECTRMLFRWTTSDDLASKGANACNIPMDTSKPVDFILYSSDVLTDLQKVGALLSHARNTKTVIFHIRDEAQSIAKDDADNDHVSCHSVHVPPKRELQYLRKYYGNLFGLNCLVTATLFPTLLEEDLWGFFGSVSQNVRAGLPLAASRQAINNTLGSKYLPKLTPALRPYISPGYIGVESLEDWKLPIDLKGTMGGVAIKAGTVASLQYGANFSGNGFLQKKVWKDDLKTFQDALWSGVETSGPTSKFQKTTTGTGTGTGTDPNYNPNPQPQPAASSSKLTKQQLQELKLRDEHFITAHFTDWLMNAHESTIHELSPQEESAEDQNLNTMVPMYLGALNVNIVEDHTISFIRHFGNVAHTRAKDNRRIGQKNVGNQLYGVTFLLYTSTFTNNDTLTNKGGGIKVIGEMTSLKNDTKVGTSPPCDMPAEKQSDSLVAFTYLPDEALNKKAKDDPHFVVFKAPSADFAIKHVYDQYGISRIAILGYSMLEAGLTVQTVLENQVKKGNDVILTKRVYCPQYVALATAKNAALDAQLQIAGRTFVELKSSIAKAAPSKWSIQLLGTVGMRNRLRRYSEMESTLAQAREKPMYDALKEKFDAQYMIDALGSNLGVVGVRRGSFGSILGITATVALSRVEANAKKQENRKRPAAASVPSTSTAPALAPAPATTPAPTTSI